MVTEFEKLGRKINEWELDRQNDKNYKPEDRLTAMALEAKADNAILLLTLDDPELYDTWINHPDSFIEPKSSLPGIVMGSFLGVKVHMSFREEDRPSYEGI